MTPAELLITAYGIPGPQGSKRYLGRGIMVESSAKVKPWRLAVQYAAIESMGGAGAKMVRGPVSVEMVFTMPRPKSAKKGSLPDRKPDISKLVRSTEDALTDAGAWEDDARVVHIIARKVFPSGGDPLALTVPGVFIHIRGLNGVA